MIKKFSFVIAVLSGFNLFGAEHSGVLFNLIVKNGTTTPLVIKTVTGAEVHVDPKARRRAIKHCNRL
ncbi:hypothetical protein Noda2021_06100 [Candidatus Dependentiae bacterium Noda2021]|nr:hypothetical protein Noda2021_06100 [Candidatus Dependentiae bacterium Noda2021]